MVPNGWKLERVGDLFDVQLGKMLNQEAKDKTPQFHYLGNSNVKWGSFDLSDLKTMHFSERDVEKFTLELDDIIMCEGGEVGRCAIWQGSDTAIFYQKALHRLRSKGQIIPQFFQSYMEKISGTKLLDDYTTRTSIAHLTREKLISLPVRLPPIPEQKEIANILSTWDKAISTTEQLLANSQQQKTALMQQLLTGKKRLLDSNGVRFSGEWITIPLEKICHINPKRPPEPKNGLVSFIPMEFVSEDAKLLSTSERFYTDVSKGFTSFLDGDTLIAKITPCFENGKGCYVQGMKNGVGFGSTEFHVLRANKLSSPLYLYYMTNTSEFRIKGEANMQGSAGQKRVTTDYLKSLKVTVPKQVEEQQKIAVVISTADQGITVLQQKLAALKQEKKALMQQLLTGKRRVKVGEAA